MPADLSAENTERLTVIKFRKDTFISDIDADLVTALITAVFVKNRIYTVIKLFQTDNNDDNTGLMNKAVKILTGEIFGKASGNIIIGKIIDVKTGQVEYIQSSQVRPFYRSRKFCSQVR